MCSREHHVIDTTKNQTDIESFKNAQNEMKIQGVAGRAMRGEPPRSTAYYYADIERLKRKNAQNDQLEPSIHGLDIRNDLSLGRNDCNAQDLARNDLNTRDPGRNYVLDDLNTGDLSREFALDDLNTRDFVLNDLNTRDFGRNDLNTPNLARNDLTTRDLKRNEPNEDHQNPNELSEYLESNEVINDGAIREVPPLRDRQWSLPEYSTPENRKPEETYSTAGTFPMPEPKEKEPLLAELEVVGRLPLTQLDSSSGVRRSRSWYLCCPNVGDEEISRDSSWRYSSLRPVTAPPLPGRNGMVMVATHSSGRGEDASALRSERDALARALAGERARAAAAARAHDARLAELHGVIAELVRRRAADKHTAAIPEEEGSDECESTTQAAGELERDADHSRTDQNDTSSMLSPAELPSSQEKVELQELADDTTDTSTQEMLCRTGPAGDEPPALALTAPDSELCVSTARCCQSARHAHAHAHALGATGAGSAGSCEREHGSQEGGRLAASPGRCESRQAKLASRVRLRRATDAAPAHEAWGLESAAAAERLAGEVCVQAGLREALVAAANDGEALSASAGLWRARCARLEADCQVLQCALARAADTAHRLSCACAVQESSCVSLCCALRAADRALEAYDVLLALAETTPGAAPERAAAELVARQLLARLEAERGGGAPALGEPLLSPGPWLQHDHQCSSEDKWSSESESRLRGHAARLKADTVTLRGLRPPPHLFSYHDEDEEDLPPCSGADTMVEMEAAVMMQEVLAAREARAAARAAAAPAPGPPPPHEPKDMDHGKEHKSSCGRRRERHWLHTAAETEL